MATFDPTDARRRSFVSRKLTAAGATFEDLGGGMVATSLPDIEAGAVERMAIADISALPRAGFKGAVALDWLHGQGLEFADTPNASYRQPDGVLVTVLAPTEALLLSPLAAPALSVTELAAACSLDDGVARFPVPRADMNFEFLICGDCAADMFAKVCGVDLRATAFAVDAVAQTSVARLTAIIVRADLGAIPAFRLLGDSASAEYMWDSLLDAMAEYDGAVVGSNDVRLT